MESNLTLAGQLRPRRIRAQRPPLRWMLANYLRPAFLWSLLAVHLGVPLSRLFGLATVYGRLEATLLRADGTRVRFGLLGYRVVTTAFVNFLASQLQTDTTEIGDFKYHDSGVGTTAEAVGDTAMETTDGESRATGTQVASTNTYTSVGTISYTSTKAITEHGLFSSASSTTLLDRTKFSAINVVSGDSIQFTYVLTLTAGG